MRHRSSIDCVQAPRQKAAASIPKPFHFAWVDILFTTFFLTARAPFRKLLPQPPASWRATLLYASTISSPSISPRIIKAIPAAITNSEARSDNNNNNKMGVLGMSASYLAFSIVHFIQFVLAITVCGLYGVDLSRAAKAGKYQDSKWVGCSGSRPVRLVCC